MPQGQFPKCVRHLTKLGQAVNITADELAESMDEHGYALCRPCSEIGRAAGHGKQADLDPRKKVLRHYRDLLDQAMSPRDVESWIGSSTLDREITPELFTVLVKMKETRIIELCLGII